MSDMGDVARSMQVAGAACPVELIELFSKKMQQGIYPDRITLAELVCSLQDRRLYLAARDVLLSAGSGASEHIKLLRAEVPDAEIEQQLCQHLYRCYADTDPWRTEILKALHEYGSLQCLETLEAVEHEFDPIYKTALVVDEAIKDPGNAPPPETANDWLSRVVRQATIAFGQRLRNAITAVRKRGQLARNEWVASGEQSVEHPFAMARVYISKAEAAAESDVGAALNSVRKAVESLLKIVIKTKGINPKRDRPVDELLLSELIPIIQAEMRPPKPVSVQLDVLQRTTTVASHDQGTNLDEFATPRVVGACVDHYRALERYFEPRLSK